MVVQALDPLTTTLRLMNALDTKVHLLIPYESDGASNYNTVLVACYLVTTPTLTHLHTAQPLEYFSTKTNISS